MKEGAAVISQTKFLALALQVILVAAIYETRVSSTPMLI
jgi:general stress protein CsbA